MTPSPPPRNSNLATPHHSFSLRTRMLVLFGALFAITYAAGILIDSYGLPFTDFGGEYGLQQEEVFAHLNLIADLKKERLQRWIEERKADVAILASEEYLVSRTAQLIESIQASREGGTPSDRLWVEAKKSDAYRDLCRTLERIKDAYPGYLSVSVADWSTLTVIVSSNADDLGTKHMASFRADARYIEYGTDGYVSDVALDEHTGQPALHLAGAVRRKEPGGRGLAQVIGLLIIQIDPDKTIRPMLNTGGGLGETGEVLLVNQQRKILTQLKHPLGDGSLAVPLEHTINAMPATLAAQGSEGLISSTDYRGEPVLAAYRHLRISPEVSWGMVAKMDEAEVYAPLRQLLRLNYAIGSIGALVALCLVVFISNRLSRPITRLSRVAAEVESGRLDARVAHTGNDEIGLLGRAFNSMIDRIADWHHDLEQQVKARTAELEAKNEELEVEARVREWAEEALKQKEEIYRNLVETSQGLIFRCDTEGRFEYLNPAWKAVLGYEPNEMLGHRFTEFKPEDVIRQDSEAFKGILDGKDIFGYETDYLTKSGARRHLVLNVRALRDKDGNPLGTQGTAYDITERKQSERALCESQAQYQQLFDSMINGFALNEIICDESGRPVDYRFLAINPAFERLTGLKLEATVGKRILEIMPNLEPIWIERFGSVALTGEPIHFEDYNEHLDKHFEVTAYRPEPGQFACVFTDITQRKVSEDALCESEEKFRLIAERAFDVIIMIDLAGTITYISPSVEQVLGHLPEHMVGKDMRDFLPKSSIPGLAGTIEMTAAGQTVEGFESQFIRKNGEIAVVEINTVPILKGGKIVGAQGIMRDITETKRLLELESRAARLETAGQIAGQVAHDFNNLLAPLIAYPDFIRDELPEDHAALPYLSDMEKTARKIADINQQLLTLGRRGHYNLEPLNLNEVVLEALEELKPLPKGMVSEVCLEADLMNVLAGRAQIHRVLANLLYNARDAMIGPGRLEIKTENWYVDTTAGDFGRIPTGEYVKVTISDTGHGIPEEVVGSIFDPFFSTKTTDKKRGSGLGLSVVDAVVKDHNGFIDLSSKPGEGTSFYLYFPITRAEVDNTAADHVVGGSETVLVVDDDAVQRDVCVMLLQKLGYRASVVTSGEEALEFLRGHPQDLMVLDMIMPGGMDGAETLRLALDICPKQRAIIVSGYAESEKVQAALDLGAGPFVRKPLTRKTLAEAVRRELDKQAVVTVR